MTTTDPTHQADAQTTIHRADAPLGRAAPRRVRNRFSFALHGCERTFEIEFSCAESDPETGLVLSARCLERVRAALFELRIMRCATVEAAAAWVFDTAERVVVGDTDGRVWVSRIGAHENRNNILTRH